jgi:hypothetical protein
VQNVANAALVTLKLLSARASLIPNVASVLYVPRKSTAQAVASTPRTLSVVSVRAVSQGRKRLLLALRRPTVPADLAKQEPFPLHRDRRAVCPALLEHSAMLMVPLLAKKRLPALL